MIRDALTSPRFRIPSSFPYRVAALLAKSVFFFILGWACCASGYAQDQACTVIPRGQEFWIRLTQAVATYSSKRDAAVGAILIASPQCQGAPVFSTGIAVRGRISYVRKVGMGVIHESAALAINFDQILAGPEPLTVRARIEEVANGREDVKAGLIEGVGGRDTPQEIMTTRLLHLPFWNPESYWIFLLRRAVFPYSPEPEIYLPAGTDLRLSLTAPLELPAGLSRAREEETPVDGPEISISLGEKVLELPSRSSTRAGQPSDVVNLAFLGSAQQLDHAFQLAGWTYGDPVSACSVLHEARAFSTLSNYSHLPISNQWLGGRASDFALQKSFDSYQKREHIRFWNEEALEQDLWVSGAIRETGASWSFRKRRFIHHVDAGIDAEREKVVRDLTMAGCVAKIYRLRRAPVGERFKNAGGDTLWTDGGVAVVQLRDCEAPPALFTTSSAALPARPRSRRTRFLRAQVLSIHDLWRSNVVYASFDVSRMFIRSLQNRSVLNRRLRELQAQEASTPVNPAVSGAN